MRLVLTSRITSGASFLLLVFFTVILFVARHKSCDAKYCKHQKYDGFFHNYFLFILN